MPLDNSPNRGYPLPHHDNVAYEDAGRVRSALLSVDDDVHALRGDLTAETAARNSDVDTIEADVAALEAATAGATENTTGVIRLATAAEATAGTSLVVAASVKRVKDMISSAITSLVGGAPAALDTLAELATALGNNASYATTITNALAAKLNLSGGTLTGKLALLGSSGAINGTGAIQVGLEVLGLSGAANAAFLQFSRPSIYSAYIGIDTDNVWKVGGQSMGANRYAIFHEGNPPFPSGTRMTFQQTSAPPGWTKDTAHNDKAFRVVNGGVSSGGIHAFSTVFAKANTDAHTLDASQMPSHGHRVGISFSAGGSFTLMGSTGNTDNAGIWADTQGGSASHFHWMDIRVAYVDLIIAQKN